MKNLKRSKYIVSVLVLALGLTITACTKPEVVAKVDNVNITKDELYDVLVEQYGAESLDALISQKIIEQEVEKNKIVVSTEEIDKEIENIAMGFGGIEALNKELESQNMNMEKIKDNIKMNISLKKLMEPNIKIEEKDMVNYFEENKERFNQEEKVNASHILVDTEELAKEVRDKLVSGENMGELAKKYSNDEGTKNKGGSLGFFGKGQMVGPFEEAAFTLNIGEISQPIKSEFGYHVIRVDEKEEAKVKTYEESKDDIKEMILEEKLPGAFSEWYNKKKSEYKIENTLKKDN